MREKLLQISHKIRSIGPLRAVKVAANRTKSRFLINTWRTKAYAGTAASTTFPSPSKFPSLYRGDVHEAIVPDLKNLNWHADGGHQFDAATFYKDISIQEFEDQGPDIKVPWELSRFQYLAQVQDSHIFISLIENWLDHNPYLLGINWLCPMEVGIRAINWLYAFDRFEGDLPEKFKQRFLCSLYDHMIYLENNWELSDGRTSNHYLSDLVGYFYTACFFKDRRKQEWAFQEINNEMQWQVFDEGTSYEGSTAYHELVTELFYHAQCVAESNGIFIPAAYRKKLKRMQQFVVDCAGVKIGDDDSGRVTNYEMPMPQKRFGLFHYKQCGLSIINTDDLHLTMRHAAYRKRQPTGHFHADAGSITLSYKGIPIVVDPGSYQYTGSKKWRNYFRSIKNHNTFFLTDHEPFNFDEMFFLAIPESDHEDELIETLEKYNVSMRHEWFQRYGITSHRKLEYDRLTKNIKISDNWRGNCDQKKMVGAAFIFAPEIELEKNMSDWIIKYHGAPRLKFSSDLDFQQEVGWVSPAYGVKEQTVALRARKQLDTEITISRFEPI